jgi:hypothetical protein
MNKNELIEKIRLKQLDMRKMMYQQYIPTQVFVHFTKDIEWYNKYIRHIQENMKDE